MALSEDLPIFRSSYDLLEKVIDLSKDLPRMLRYTVGERLIDQNLAMLSQVYRANLADDKLPAITELLVSQRTMLMLLRVVYRQKVVSTGRYAELLRLLDSIGKQATGWKNKEQKSKEDGTE